MLASCSLMQAGTYSIQEQYDLSAARSAQVGSQLGFSISLVSDHVPFEQDIFFTAAFTNTTNHPIVFRVPRQYGVVEILDVDTTLWFRLEPVNVVPLFKYPRDALRPDILVWPPVERDEFVKLPQHGTHRIQLKLPRMVLQNGEMGNVISLAPGQYFVHMTYLNDYIGYEVKRGEETRYTDIGAWTGKVESNPALLTITAP
jgi:hypothetical protein